MNRIDKIRERIAATTPGRWRAFNNYVSAELDVMDRGPIPAIMACGNNESLTLTPTERVALRRYIDDLRCYGGRLVGESMCKADAEFIAYAKEDIVFLLETIAIFSGALAATMREA